MNEVFLVFGDNLFPLAYFERFKKIPFLMIEGPNLQHHYKYHKVRLAFLQSASRHKFLEFKAHGYNVSRINLTDDSLETSYCARLEKFCIKNKISKIHTFGKEDKFFNNEVIEICKKLSIDYITYRSPLFLNTHEDFKVYLSKYKKPFMKNFYEDSRKRFNVLVDKDKKPIGGKWSFDEDNRKKLKKDSVVPQIDIPKVDEVTLEVIREINSLYKDHPGELDESGKNFLFPVTRDDAVIWLEQFFKKRFHFFGEFEDAISTDHDYVFHSLLSPLINVGLLTPSEVIDKALKYSKEHKVPLNSLEGLIRQILGWREFVRGIYQNFSEIQEERNFFNHQRKLTIDWYEGTTGIDPVDHVIKKVKAVGYLHHIERLMILSNIMLLCEIDPKEVHRWFNEMFVDSMDWVMGPNVYGMGQFSDGGIFATKPYISGSNYIMKMSNFKSGEWNNEVDSLFWSFIAKKRDFFIGNPRLSMMVRTLDKMSEEKKQAHLNLADLVRERVSTL